MLDNHRNTTGVDEVLASVGDAEWFEYSRAANPIRPSLTPPVPYHAFLPNLYAFGPTRLIPLDLSEELRCAGPATSPGLCANFGRILPGETLLPDIAADAATSIVFYVIRGSGRTKVVDESQPDIVWKEGDFVALPGGAAYAHQAGADAAAFYLVHDAPLLRHLGVAVNTSRFKPTVYAAETTRSLLDQIAQNPDSANRSRISLLLGNKRFPQLRTITHVVWAMYGVVKPGSVQKPHRHQSVALDFIVSCGPGAYTLIGRELDGNGNIVNPARQDWTSGMVFVTPPGYWHAHFNEGDEPSYVVPLQDAGLQTYLRSLDIRFS
jgi:gentisate 1,2-dioxygenase